MAAIENKDGYEAVENIHWEAPQCGWFSVRSQPTAQLVGDGCAPDDRLLYRDGEVSMALWMLPLVRIDRVIDPTGGISWMGVESTDNIYTFRLSWDEANIDAYIERPDSFFSQSAAQEGLRQ